jgi:uncharacterized protein YcgI (DUF1989 family)
VRHLWLRERDRDDLTDRLSVGNTRKMANSIFVSTGAVLWSTTYHQLARIESDSVGRHDLIASACTPYDYPIRFGERGVGHRACLTNLREALAPWGIPEPLIPGNGWRITDLRVEIREPGETTDRVIEIGEPDADEEE